MKFDPNKHHRASTRMKGYNYSLAGAYFITIVTYHRECLFGDIVDGEMQLNDFGKVANECWLAIPEHFPFIELDLYVVMPNHVHGIVWIVEDRVSGVNDVGANGRSPLRDQPYIHMKPKSLSSFVAGFKSSVTKRIRDELNETGIWQRNYHDRIIRNEKELDAVRKYIDINPQQWAEDEENPKLGK